MLLWLFHSQSIVVVGVRSGVVPCCCCYCCCSLRRSPGVDWTANTNPPPRPNCSRVGCCCAGATRTMVATARTAISSLMSRLLHRFPESLPNTYPLSMMEKVEHVHHRNGWGMVLRRDDMRIPNSLPAGAVSVTLATEATVRAR